MSVEAIKFDRSNIELQILDQLLLPYQTKYITINSISDAFGVIKLMQVRGAPAIAIVGSFAVVIEAKKSINKPGKDLIDKIDWLITSRPTAVNLSNALNDIKQLIGEEINQETYDKIYKYAVELYDDDLSNNYKIGDNGVNYITKTLKEEDFKGAFSIITICNTGSLATSGHGTALGIIRSTYKQLREGDFHLDSVYPCETRPYNQGAKLTTYELKYEKIPFTLVCDNMVSSLIRKQKNKAPVKFIIVGADRIVKNGDTANKIGTFQLSTIANYFNSQGHGIKFIVAAPRTTIDLNTESGEDIVIEERPSRELTTLTGPVIQGDDVGEKLTVGIATPGIEVWNPAFDVTPHSLIDAIVTEDDYIVKDKNGEFNLLK
ncbi:unnamed protein product [Candida verbasci]|uniref:Methylthioribose-1-phosphate isomerase n=1 Tax=Candida verbasci TaxID=1227364 RepID=A0A9W4TU09_9ASCO|nr:unnamed protein product [Candida verbasci]